MQGKVIPMGSKSVTIYYSILFFVAGAGIAILLGLLWSVSRLPSCTSVSKEICGVNDWSIAGLAATILGVAATVLAFLGAFAVAFFWKDLNTQVEAQVDKRTEERLKVIEDNLQTKMQEHVDLSIMSIERRAKERYKELEETDNRLLDEWQRLQKYVECREQLYLGGILSQNPWHLEDWAKEWTEKAPASPIAEGMAARYTRAGVDFLDALKQGQPYVEKNGTPFTEPEDYLQAASEWVTQIQNEENRISANHKIEKYILACYSWKTSPQPQPSSSPTSQIIHQTNDTQLDKSDHQKSTQEPQES